MIFSPTLFTALGPERATAVFPVAWPVFAGHFPGNPVVPAYILVGLVLAHAEHAVGAPLTLRTVDRMKLARAVGPDEPVTSELESVDRQADSVKVRSRLSTAGIAVGSLVLSARVGA